LRELNRRWTCSLAAIVCLSFVVPVSGQARGDSLLQPALVREFDQAVSVAATATAVFVVDAGAATVTRIVTATGEVDVYSGSGGRDGRLQSASDVDPTNGLNILVCDQGSGRILRLSRDLTPIEFLQTGSSREPTTGLNTFDAAADWRLLPIRIASIDEKTIAILDGPTSRVFRWTADRGIDQRFGSGTNPPEAPVDIAADSRSVYVADRQTGCLFVYDTMGSFIRRMACEPAEELVSVNHAAGRLWVTRRADTPSGEFAVVESWLQDGSFAGRYVAPDGLGVVGAVGAAGQIWLLTPSALYASPPARGVRDRR